MNQNTSTKGYSPSELFYVNTEKNGTLGLSVEEVFYVNKSEEEGAVNIYGKTFEVKTGNPVSCSQSCIFVRVFLPVRPVDI